jgi:hypothetical protein
VVVIPPMCLVILFWKLYLYLWLFLFRALMLHWVFTVKGQFSINRL